MTRRQTPVQAQPAWKICLKLKKQRPYSHSFPSNPNDARMIEPKKKREKKRGTNLSLHSHWNEVTHADSQPPLPLPTFSSFL